MQISFLLWRTFDRMLRLVARLSVVLLLTPQSWAVIYEVGPGHTLQKLSSVPWASLHPGDTVNIHYQPDGYHEIILLSNSGATNAPVTINGVPDPDTGMLPTLDGQNAVTATNAAWSDPSLHPQGIIVVSREAHQPYGYIPSWVVIQNLHVQNADPSQTLTQSDGTARSFDNSASAIYVEYAQHLVIRGCELNNSCNGVFCGSKNNDPNQLSADVLIEHSWIHDNGYPNNYEAANVGTECAGVVLQFNRIGPLRAGAGGDQIKDRSSGTCPVCDTRLLGGQRYCSACGSRV